MQVERGDLERGLLCAECAVRAPDLEHGVDREVRGGQVVCVYLLFLTRHPYREQSQLALNREVRGLGA